MTMGLFAAIALTLPVLAAPAPPGDHATIFAPGHISGPGADIAPTFLPDGATLYFSRRIDGRFTVMSARRVGLAWTPAEIAPFSGRWTDLEATVSDRATPSPDADRAGPEHLFIAFQPTSPRPLVCAIAIPGWSDVQESAVEPRFSPDEGLLYFASRHPDHVPGAPTTGPWDDGTANIWVIRFTSKLWRRAPGANAACKAHGAD